VFKYCNESSLRVKKLSPSWKDFKNYIKHKQKDMGVEDLIMRLKTEDNILLEMRANIFLMVGKI
jgi:hypothetical protein